MYVEIHHNTNEPLSDHDKAILLALAGAESAPAPAAKASAPAPAAKASKAAPKAEKKAEPEPEDTAEDEVEETAPEPDTEASDDVTLEQAVALATKMVSAGKAADVKKALGAVGAKKVSEIPEGKVGEFVALLS